MSRKEKSNSTVDLFAALYRSYHLSYSKARTQSTLPLLLHSPLNHIIMLRSTRLIRSIPSTSRAAIRQKSSSTRSELHTSTQQNTPYPAQDRGISLDAKARVRDHVRKIQSSAKQGAAPVVRPNPSPNFQVPPEAQIRESPQYRDPLQGDSQVRNGLDYS